MTSSPLVSIITPSYNQSSFIEKTILSVLEQDYTNIEYMIADGGSTDGSVEIIKKYAKKLKWWVSEKDNGQAEAINKGLERSKGKYVAWINSDDYYQPGTISEAVKVLEESPNLGFVFGNVRVVDKDNHVINNLSYGDWGIKELMSFHIIGQPAVFMRRSTVEKAGFLDLNYHFLLDHQLWLRLALIADMKYVPRLWASAHYHEGCKNLAQASEFGKEAARIVDWMRTDSRFSKYLIGNEKKVKAGAERLDGFYLLDAKNYRGAFWAYWKAFWLHPGSVRAEWYRMVFTFFAPLGLEKFKEKYILNRKRKLTSKNDLIDRRGD